jgi:transcription-repair coupling factor (superfamily II helicase)
VPESCDPRLNPSLTLLDAVWPAAERALEPLLRRAPRTLVHGLPGSSRAFFLAWAFRHMPGKDPWVVVTPNREEALALQGDLTTWLPGVEVRLCPSWEVLPLDVEEPDAELVGERLRAFLLLQQGGPGIVVAPLVGALQGTLPPTEWLDRLLLVRKGMELPRDLEQRLAALGFERAGQVLEAGQFAVRGGLVDLAPPGSPSGPVRIERFGDVVDSIRHLDLTSQRSSGEVAEVSVFPAHEVVMTPAIRASIVSRLRDKAREDSLWARMAGELLDSSGRFPGWEWHVLGAMSGARPASCLWDHVPPGARVIVLEPAAVAQQAEDLSARIDEWGAEAAEEGADLFPVRGLFGDAVFLRDALAAGRAVGLGLLPQELFGEAAQGFPVAARLLPPYYGKFASFVSDVRKASAGGVATHLLCHNRGERDRMRELMAEEGIAPVLSVGEVEQGFALDDLAFQVLPDHDLFRRYRVSRHPRRRRSIAEGRPLASLSELAVGSLAVHVDHGLCLYRGLTPLTVDAVTKDYIQLEFADTEKVYLPTDQIALVQRYVGAEGSTPLAKLGGEAWNRTKERVRKRVAEVARDLVALYQARAQAVKTPLPPDTPWQGEFEDSFAYDLTPGQARCIREIKKDLQSGRPMDRLLCGDVGYGKTEVAMRAAFKVVQDRRQVAVLAPTTILAQQHAHTFRERMAEYPVRIGMLSRFVPAREQKAVLAAAAAGDLDIVVGTHRLLMKDVRFARLGLLVVDEEHRFGVAQKERLKRLKRDVDVLALTATPIPRTLHMSLSGIREVSVIDTPPENRLSVSTHIGPFDPRMVAEAVRREMHREGQVFYVHNHVRDIERVADRLHRMVPEARLAVAHGQLTEHELESVMAGFVAGESDVLVCTSIVESGLDMPRVNTLIVERSDVFGLAQLYQLKGRVGRTDRQAYAYFFHPPAGKGAMREMARKRLEALQEFRALGSGMHIALRDLEIRGAGNLLGLDQHGHLDAVGLGLYSSMLSAAVAREKGEEVLEDPHPEISIAVTAFLPDGYVPVEVVKVDFYRRLVDAATEAEVEAVREELVDRFGPLPPPATVLMKVALLRPRLRRLGLRRLEEQSGWVTLTWHPARAPEAAVVAGWVRRTPPARLRFDPKDPHTVSFRIIKGNEPDEARLDAVGNLLRELDGARNITPF